MKKIHAALRDPGVRVVLLLLVVVALSAMSGIDPPRFPR